MKTNSGAKKRYLRFMAGRKEVLNKRAIPELIQQHRCAYHNRRPTPAVRYY